VSVIQYFWKKSPKSRILKNLSIYHRMNINQSTVIYHLNGYVQNVKKVAYGKRLENLVIFWVVIAIQLAVILRV